MGDQILARKINENFVTVRVRSTLDGGSDVWVMTTPMQPPTMRSEPPPHLALPAGSRVLSNVETVDGATPRSHSDRNRRSRHSGDAGFSEAEPRRTRIHAGQLRMRPVTILRGAYCYFSAAPRM